MKFLDCNGEPIKKGYIVFFNEKLEDGSIKRTLGKVIKFYNDQSLLLHIMGDDKFYCTVPAKHVSISLPTNISVKNDRLLNHPEEFPAYTLTTMNTENKPKTWVVLKTDDFYSVHRLKEGQEVPENAIRVIESDDFSTLEIGDKIKFRDKSYYEFKDKIHKGIIVDVIEEDSQLYGKDYCILVNREVEFDGGRILAWKSFYYTVNDVLEIVDFSLDEYDVKDKEGKPLHVGDVVSYPGCILTFENDKKPTGTILEIHPYKNVVRARFKNENTGKWFERTMVSNWVKLLHSEA